jgi:predicted secreted protein
MVRSGRAWPVLVVILGVLLSPFWSTAPASAASGHTVVVTEADDGTTVHLHPGQTLTVKLQGSEFMHWEQATSSDPHVLRGSRGTRMGGGGNFHGTFRALRTGTADVTDIDAPVCHHHVCPPGPTFFRQWTVHVTVA